jgi:hypothetical protein
LRFEILEHWQISLILLVKINGYHDAAMYLIIIHGQHPKYLVTEVMYLLTIMERENELIEREFHHWKIDWFFRDFPNPNFRASEHHWIKHSRASRKIFV